MNLTRSFLTKIPKTNNKNDINSTIKSNLVIVHHSESFINNSCNSSVGNTSQKYNLNKFAKNSLKYDNDAKRRAVDEAISIHIITEKLKSKLKILFESQIPQFYGKPDVIIRLGKNFYIMISITRAMQKNSIFNEDEAYRLIKKKIDGLYICSNNLDCLITDILYNYRLQSIVHILVPNIEHSNLCITAYKKYCSKNKKKSQKIKLLISIIDFTDDIIS